jgi:hypothetical protein
MERWMDPLGEVDDHLPREFAHGRLRPGSCVFGARLGLVIHHAPAPKIADSGDRVAVDCGLMVGVVTTSGGRRHRIVQKLQRREAIAQA